MWKYILPFSYGLLLCACAHSAAQDTRFDGSSDNLAGVWQAVWVKGFDPDWPRAAEGPFDWTKNQLATNPDDPGNWGKFYGGCNKLWRYREPVKDKSDEMVWNFWPGLEGCSELVNNGEAEILARSMLLERALAEHIVKAQDYRMDYEINTEGLLIWLDGDNNPVARFKPLPDWHSCESLRERARPMPIECSELVNAAIMNNE